MSNGLPTPIYQNINALVDVHAESLLHLSGGVIWTALCLDYPGHSFSDIGLYYGMYLLYTICAHVLTCIPEGVNARLPNQDLLNSIQMIAQWTGQVPVVIYDHPIRRYSWISSIVSLWSSKTFDPSKLQNYESKAINILKHMGYQAFGRPSGVHGLFHQSVPFSLDMNAPDVSCRYRIDAITLYAVPALGPHGFYTLGK